MLQVGDRVVTMGVPGAFEVISITGERVTIQNARGVRKVVLVQALRRLERPAAPEGNPAATTES